MPVLIQKTPAYKPSKNIERSWNNFRKGLVTILRPTEIPNNALVQADNLMLTGSGVPTKRWGTANYFLAGTGEVKGLGAYYPLSGDPELLAVTDDGYLVKKSNASYAIITGASYPSVAKVEMTQLNDKEYLVSELREMIRYDGTNLTGFPTVSYPSNVYATQISGASGTNTYSYRITTITTVGETVGTEAFSISNQPQSLEDGAILVSWTPPSAPSGVTKGFNIYGREEGDERFLGTVDRQSTNFIDNGDAIPQEFTYPPTANSTGGVKCKYIIRFQDRLVFAGIDGDPSKVIIGGRVPLHERTDISYGGNYIRIEPDAGDDITGLTVFEGKIIVFKEKSIWQVTLSSIQVGNYYVTVPEATLITKSHGCISHRTIVHVENDVFFLSRKGVYVLGYEPNILNVLRTNEVSANIRPFFDGITPTQLRNATAIYCNSKYILSFPGTNKTLQYDRERTAWMGPWTYDATVYNIFYDSNNDEVLVYGKDSDGYVNQISSDYKDDEGAAITTILRTKIDDFGDWSLFKTIKDSFFNFRNISGTVNLNIRLEEETGNTVSALSSTIETTAGNAGWGADMWSNALWGDSEEEGGGGDINNLVRSANLNKIARTVQYEIKTDNRNDNYELLAIRTRAKPISQGFMPSTWKLS